MSHYQHGELHSCICYVIMIQDYNDYIIANLQYILK